MPLENAPVGSKGFGHNVATEIKAGKPEKQAAAIAYSKARGDAERDLEGPSTTEGAFDSNRSRAAIAQELSAVEKDLEELSRAGRSKAYTALCRKRDNLEDELKSASKDPQFPPQPTAAMLAKLDAMLSCADSVIADAAHRDDANEKLNERLNYYLRELKNGGSLSLTMYEKMVDLAKLLKRTGDLPQRRNDDNDKLSNKTKEEIAPSKRDDMPRSAFLRPSERKYPVKLEKDGAWCYDHKLLVAAAREARMHGDEDLANEADKLREKEFAGRAGVRGYNDADRRALSKEEALSLVAGTHRRLPNGELEKIEKRANWNSRGVLSPAPKA